MLLTLLVTAKYFPALDQGYDACPCVDPYPLSGPGTGHSNCSGILRGRACYPSGYGARGCRAYDNSCATPNSTSSFTKPSAKTTSSR